MSSVSVSKIRYYERLKQKEKERRSKRAKEKIKVINKELSTILSSDLLETYKEEFKNLKKELNKIEQISSLSEKEKRIEQIKINIKFSLKNHDVAKTIDISGVEEEKTKIILSKEKKQIALEKLRNEIYSFYKLVKDIDEDVYIELGPIVKILKKKSMNRE